MSSLLWLYSLCDPMQNDLAGQNSSSLVIIQLQLEKLNQTLGRPPHSQKVPFTAFNLYSQKRFYKMIKLPKKRHKSTKSTIKKTKVSNKKYPLPFARPHSTLTSSSSWPKLIRPLSVTCGFVPPLSPWGMAVFLLETLLYLTFRLALAPAFWLLAEVSSHFLPVTGGNAVSCCDDLQDYPPPSHKGKGLRGVKSFVYW